MIKATRKPATDVTAVQFDLTNTMDILELTRNNQHGYFLNEFNELVIHMNDGKMITMDETDWLVKEVIDKTEVITGYTDKSFKLQFQITQGA